MSSFVTGATLHYLAHYVNLLKARVRGLHKLGRMHQTVHMSMNPVTDPRFELDLADRMTKAVRHSGLGVQELADRIQVSRNAVSSWINGRHKPRRRDLAAFALATGYPVSWLETGQAGNGETPPGGGGVSGGSLPGLDSNQEPAG